MFNNIGSKIMGMASFFTWCGIIISVISGCAVIGDSTMLGLIIITVGCLISWVSSLVLYGFGQLIENTERMLNSTNSYTNDVSASSHDISNENIKTLEKIKTEGLLSDEELQTLNSLEWSRKEGIITEAEYQKKIKDLIH